MKPSSKKIQSARSQLSKKSSLNPLNPLEEEFIYAAEFGDIPTVERILIQNPTFSVDYSDILGRTPLRLAVGNEHREIVELLLDRCKHSMIHEALLQAISLGHEQIAETILKHSSYVSTKRENKLLGKTDYFYETAASDESQFSADVTPLILAAEKNQFEIVQLLLLRGERIVKPHDYFCACQECSNKLQFDELRLAKMRLKAYKGLASGAYISLSTQDPLITAFDLSRELRRVARIEKYFKKDYLALSDQLSVYVVQLLDRVRNHDELQLVLDKATKRWDDERYERLSRLKLAIHYNLKKFVAHPSCQQKLVSIWYGNLRYLERSSWISRIFLIIAIVVVYPVLAALYLVVPRSLIGRFLRVPCVKFIGHTMFFLIFLIMIIISSVIEVTEIVSFSLMSYNNVTYCHYVTNLRSLPTVQGPNLVLRTVKPQIIHILLTTWILGMLWQEIKQLYGNGFYVYVDSVYNLLDSCLLTLYIASFALRYVSIYKVQYSVFYFEKRENWLNMLGDDFQYHFYWLTADRFTWNTWDPHIVCEGLFAMANVITFARITYLLPANELFGPMQISLAKMATELMKFFAILMTIFFAFMVGLHNLYWYYPATVRGTVENPTRNLTFKASGHFGILEKTFQTVFWSIFGRGDSDAVELGPFQHIFTQNVGYIIFGAYNIVLVIVLLNMLIAMMTQSFDKIQAEADTEWKFARTKLYMEFIEDGSTLPVPFNLIPTPKFFWHVFVYVKDTLCQKEPEFLPHPGRVKDYEMFAPPSESRGEGKGGRRISAEEKRGIKHFQMHMNTFNGVISPEFGGVCSSSSSTTYQSVMKRVVKRYIFDMQRESDNMEGNMDELKQDISSFRFEMLNHINMEQNVTRPILARIAVLEKTIDVIMENQSSLLRYLSNSRYSDRSLEMSTADRSSQTDAATGVSVHTQLLCTSTSHRSQGDERSPNGDDKPSRFKSKAFLRNLSDFNYETKL